MSAVLATAGTYIGTTEIKGMQHNPKIVEMFAKCKNAGIKDDETPWCAAFVGAVLHDVGVDGTFRLNARSYLSWGVSVVNPRPGDIVVFWRGKRDGWKGHVAFFVRNDGSGNVVVIGGNQDDSVSEKGYATSRVLGYRRAKTKPKPRKVGPIIGHSRPVGTPEALDPIEPEEQPTFWAAFIAAIVAIFGGKK